MNKLKNKLQQIKFFKIPSGKNRFIFVLILVVFLILIPVFLISGKQKTLNNKTSTINKINTVQSVSPAPTGTDVLGAAITAIPTPTVKPIFPTQMPTTAPASNSNNSLSSSSSNNSTSQNTNSNSSSQNSNNTSIIPTFTPAPTVTISMTPTPTSSQIQSTVNITINDPGGSSNFQVKLNSGADACDELQEAKNEGKINSVAFDDSYMSSLHSRYVTEINGFSNNWTFTVNGNSPLGCSLIHPQPNDNIVWKFG